MLLPVCCNFWPDCTKIAPTYHLYRLLCLLVVLFSSPFLCTPLPPFLISSSLSPLSSSAIAYLLPLFLLPPSSSSPPLESGSARFNAEQMARTVQARIVANKTSQGVGGPMGPNIYAREPNKALSFYIGNLTWVREDLYLAFCWKGMLSYANTLFHSPNKKVLGHSH